MSIHGSTLAENAFSNAYVVAAPRPADALSATLRRAYATSNGESEQFADLMRQLDGIENLPR